MNMIAVALAFALTGADAQPHIWPVAGLYGLDRSACSGDTKLRTANVDPAFCNILAVEERRRLGSEFAALVADSFPMRRQTLRNTCQRALLRVPSLVQRLSHRSA